MKSKFLQVRKMLLVAVGLLVGASAWGATQTLYSQNYNNATSLANYWTVLTGGSNLATADNYGNYVLLGQTDKAAAGYTLFDELNIPENATEYTIEFDGCFRPGFVANGYSEFVLMSKGATLPTNSANFQAQNADFANALFYMHLTNGTSAMGNNKNYTDYPAFSVSGQESGYTYPGKTNDYWGGWYHWKFVVNRTTRTVAYTIGASGNASSLTGTYNLPEETSADIYGISVVMSASWPSFNIDNITITTEVEGEVANDPSIQLTGINGTSRTYTITCDAGATLGYKLPGASDFTEVTLESEKTTYEVTATQSGTLYAYVKNGAATSNTVETEVTAEDVQLNVPTISVSALTLNNTDGLYYQTIVGNYDASGVLLEPKATLSATFNGSAVSLPYVATAAGTLVITASYDGYTSATYNYDVVGYTKVLWQDYTTLTAEGLPAGIRKWSGNDHWELAEGYGIKAIRDDGRGDAWVQIDRAGMIAYDKLSAASEDATTETIVIAANSNSGNDSFQYFAKETVLSKIYYFVEGQPVSVSEAGFATYVNKEKDLDFSATGIEAYTVKVSTKGVATLTKVDEVPAGTPVLLYKEGGATDVIPVITDAAAVGDNDLVAGTGAVVATTDGTYTNMILNVVDEKIGFYFANNQTVAANRAYLHIATELAPDAASGTRMLISFDGETTGIAEVEKAGAENGAIYNLSGQRVSKPANGLYIVNGKKVIIK